MLTKGRIAATVFAVLAVLTLLATGLTAAPGLSWKRDILGLKYSGSLPNVGWVDLLRGVVHPEVFQWTPGGIENLEERLVRVTARETGVTPCPVLWESAIGNFWGRTSDESLLRLLITEQVLEGIYEDGDVAIRPGDVVVDAGSHLGTFTRFALHRGARLVVAFEPEPVNIACFKRNFEQEIRDGRVVLIEAAVWETVGELRFQAPKGMNSGTGAVRTDADDGSFITIPATTLDATVARLKLDAVDYIKMDIEGSERFALRGARETLTRFAPRMALCVYHKPDDPEVLPQTAQSINAGYKVHRRGNQAFFTIDNR
jgi:FkbM family methyltransferase